MDTGKLALLARFAANRKARGVGTNLRGKHVRSKRKAKRSEESDFSAMKEEIR